MALRMSRKLLFVLLAVLLIAQTFSKSTFVRAEDDIADDDDRLSDFGPGDDYDASDLDEEGGVPEEDDAIKPGDDGDVKALDEASFNELVKSKKTFLAEFYAPWCGHCKALAPEFREAAAVLKEFGVLLGKIDATEHEDLAKNYEVQGYPSLIFFNGSMIREYNGGRTADDIVNWVKKKLGFAVYDIESKADAEVLAASVTSPTIVAFFKDDEGLELESFKEAAAEIDGAIFYHTSDPEIAAAVGLPTDKPWSLALLKEEDEKFVSFDGEEFTIEAISTFVVANKFPLLIVFSDVVASDVFGGPLKKQVIIFGSDEQYQEQHALLTEAAKSFKGKLMFVFVNASDADTAGPILEFFGVPAESTEVHVVGFDGESKVNKFRMEEALSLNSLKAFATAFGNGTAKPFFKSEPIPEENDGDVTVVVGNSFESIVLDDTKDVLLEVYATWCGHCKTFAPIYEKIGAKLKGVPSLVVAKMEGTANEYPGLEIEGFPTLLLYPAGDKANLIKVDAELKLKPILKFVKKNAAIPFTLPSPKGKEETKEAAAGAKDEL